MRIAIGSDHLGLPLKRVIRDFLKEKGIQPYDFGTMSEEPVDYPDIAKKVAQAIMKGEYDRGILVCGTGIGMCITANKLKGIRAALAYDIKTAQISRLHNDANVLCLGGREISEAKALDIVDVWLNTSFEGGRHQLRIDKIPIK